MAMIEPPSHFQAKTEAMIDYAIIPEPNKTLQLGECDWNLVANVCTLGLYA